MNDGKHHGEPEIYRPRVRSTGNIAWCPNMSRCNWCAGKGLIFIRYQGESGYSIASCSCRDGQWYRQKGLLRAWAAKQTPKPDAIGRLEEFFPDLTDMVGLYARTEAEAEKEMAARVGGSTQTKAS